MWGMGREMVRKEGRKQHKNDRRKRKKAVEEVGQKEGREESEK